MKRTSCSMLFWCARFSRSQAGWPAVAGARTPYVSRARATRKPSTITSTTASTMMSVTTDSMAIPPSLLVVSVRPEAAVLPLEEEQRAAAAHFRVLYLTDVDHVIPALVGLHYPALHVRQRTLEHGYAIPVRDEGQGAELLTA